MKVENLKSVLLISHELSLTGAPVALQYMARQLKKDGIFMTVLSPKDGPLRQEFIKDGITVIIDGSITGNKEWIKWAKGFDLIVVNTVVIFHLINQLSDLKLPVIWWTHDGEMSFELGANDLLPKKVGENIHAFGGGGYAKKILDKYRPLYHAEELIYCVPDYANLLDNKYEIIIDKKDKKYLFSSVGSIDRRKGQDIFVEAIRNLPCQYLECCLFLFVGREGDAAIYNKVKMLKRDFPDNIELITEVSRNEVRDIYRQSTVVVCTSRDDPMPVFMTESLMLSVPIICSEYTGTFSLIKDKENGLVYHNNNISELTDLIKYVVDNPDKMVQMGIQGREVYENNFTEKAFKDNFYNIIEGI